MLDQAFIQQFQSNSKKAIQRLISEGKLQRDPQSVSALLRSPELDLAAVGDYLGDGDEFCQSVLSKFVSDFDLGGLGFDDALRKFLAAFRLPGEAQKIDRIMHAYKNQFNKHNPNLFHDPDTAWVLAFSVIMLNTDAHNPAIKAHKKMTKEQFLRNNRGLDSGHDLPKEFLERIYDRIVANEIIMQPIKNDVSDKSILTYTNPDKAGWIRKQSSRVRSWNERWFVLKNGCMYYFRKPPVWGQESELCGHIPLHPHLLFKETEPGQAGDGQFVVEMRNGQPLKCGKIDKRVGNMKTIVVQHLRLLAPSRNDRDDWITALRAAVGGLGTSNRASPPSNNNLNGGGRPAALAPVAQNSGGSPPSVATVSSGTPNPQAPVLAGGATPKPQPTGGTPNLQAPVLGTPGTSTSGQSFPQFPSLSPCDVAILSPPDAPEQSAGTSGPPQSPHHPHRHGVEERQHQHSPPPAPAPSARGIVDQTATAPSVIGTPNAAPVGLHVHVPGNGTGGETIIAHPGSPTPVSAHAGGAVGSPQRGSEPASASGISGGTQDAFPVSFDSGEGFASPDQSSQIIGERVVHGQAAAGQRCDPSSSDRRVAVEEAVGSVAEDAYARKTFEFRVRVREGVDLAVRGPMALFESGLQMRLETFYSGHRKWPLSKETHPNLEPLQMALAGFGHAPDGSYADRVRCSECGLSVGAWEPEDDAMDAHVRFVTDSAAPTDCRFIREHSEAYAALAEGMIQSDECPSRDCSQPAASVVASPAAAAVDEEELSVADARFLDSLVKLERVSQRLVVEQQYGQRLETLASSLRSKIDAWQERLDKEQRTITDLKRQIAEKTG